MGYEGVFRTSHGFVKVCFQVLICLAYAFEAQNLAVIHALEVTQAFGWFNIWIKCDSTYMVNLIQTECMTVPWHRLVRWSSCMHFLKSISFKVSHIF